MRFLNHIAGRLSRLRRHRLAGAFVLLFGLIVSGLVYNAAAPTAVSADDGATSAEQVAQGKELFLVGCSYCHGMNGQGVRTEREDRQLGPSLVGVGAAAVDFQMETGRMPMAQPGAQAPSKPEAYTEEEIQAIAAYVASLGPGPAIPSPEQYNLPPGLSADERNAAIVEGGQIFLTNCSACHNFEGSGGAMPNGGYAPKIRGVDPKHIYEAMLTGPQTMDNFSDGNIAPEDKAKVIAYLGSIDDNPGYGGFSLGGLGPVSEGLFAWLFGIGACVGFAVWIASHTARTKRKKGEA